MTKPFLALALIAMLIPLALTQDGRIPPPATLRESTQLVSTQPDTEPVMKKGPGNVSFCPPKTCLYYAGDFDSTDTYANGLFNADYAPSNLVGQAWVGVKPDRDATVTGATFVEFLTGGYTVVNPTPFAVQVGIKPGQAGKTVCSTSGNATVTEYQGFDWGILYSVTIKKLSQPCKLKKGRVYYVNLLPISDNGYGYVANVLDSKPKNHYGWKNDLNDCYFNGAAFGASYVTCDSQGAFSELSIALTGKE